MKKILPFLLFFTTVFHAQNDSIVVDNKYLEDQIYVGFVYQTLLGLPDEITQTGFSYGVGFGFIKDLPINKLRDKALGFGLGYNYNTHYFNFTESDSNADVNESVTKSNRVGIHNIELPVEFRFRTSTPTKYKFWRIYPGFKFSYGFSVNTNLKQSEDFDVKEIIKVNKFQYGITLSAGYNKWNLFAYYGLSELYNKQEHIPIDISPNELKLGLIFYML
ncbi:MAG: porin family protein [Bacteroidota bacterium]